MAYSKSRALHGRALRAHLVDNHDGDDENGCDNDDDDDNNDVDENDDDDNNYNVDDQCYGLLTWLRGWGLCTIWRQRGRWVPDNNHQASNISKILELELFCLNFLFGEMLCSSQ